MTSFRQLHDSPNVAYTYLIVDTEAGAAVVIDPAAERTIVTLLALVAELDLQLEHVPFYARSSGRPCRHRRHPGADSCQFRSRSPTK